MAQAQPLLLLALLAATFAVTAALGGRGRIVGGWGPIGDVTDPHIQELGGWAVTQHAKLAGDRLQFRRVTRGEEQVVSGMNYRLFVEAVDGTGTSAPYVAVVYEQAWTRTRELTSFKPAANY
jgi:cystatin-C